ncbi:hypothetical protein J4219_09250 [Candidatus Woesearchaeota archaeon]|nr:hypothetical protein [Candidatus Woesearchaeota archaeon]
MTELIFEPQKKKRLPAEPEKKIIRPTPKQLLNDITLQLECGLADIRAGRVKRVR